MRATRSFVRARSTRWLPIALVAFVLGCSESEPLESEGFRALVEPARKEEKVALPDPSLWETPLADPELESGRVVWAGTCIQCHSNGLGGAPLIGNRTLWVPRIEKGLEVLVGHATQGFYGDVGEMPARGGNPSLSDDEVRVAVRFMVTRVNPGR